MFNMTQTTPQDNTASTAALLQALLDRQQIQDLFTRYYAGLDGTDPAAFGKYFAPDAQLDVNGMVAHGQDEIAELYRRVRADKPPRTGTFRMILSNPLIEVTGRHRESAILMDTASQRFAERSAAAHRAGPRIRRAGQTRGSVAHHEARGHRRFRDARPLRRDV
jgi:uncharacterized protein (TIGR02246 family)